MEEIRNKMIAKLIGIEGGYVNDPSDSGGATKYGITQATARANGFTRDMKEMSEKVATAIYIKQYWNDRYLEVGNKLAWTIFQIGVVMGVATAVQTLQKTLNEDKPAQLLEVDGVFGTKTIEECKRQSATILGRYILNIQKRFDNIVLAKPQNKKFLKGWKNRSMIPWVE